MQFVLPCGSGWPGGHVSVNLWWLSGDTKVGHFGNQILVQQDITRFHIPVYYRRILHIRYKKHWNRLLDVYHFESPEKSIGLSPIIKQHWTTKGVQLLSNWKSSKICLLPKVNWAERLPQRSEGSPILEQHEEQSPDACTNPTWCIYQRSSLKIPDAVVIHD